LAGFFTAGFFMNFYKAVFWGGGNFVGYGVAVLIGYFLSTTISEAIVHLIPGGVPFDFVPILQPILFLVLILVIVGIWNLIILLPIYFLVYRRFMKKHIDSLKFHTSKKPHTNTRGGGFKNEAIRRFSQTSKTRSSKNDAKK
jgi:uncharacterized membrane protein (DUF106 family)